MLSLAYCLLLRMCLNVVQMRFCIKEIDWRPEALRVILFTSDASPHIAMDGKLAAILDINDMECHLEEVNDQLTIAKKASPLKR